MLLVQRALAESPEQAQRLIMAGLVLADGQPAGKAGERVDVDIALGLKARPRFVSRGGEKLEAAFDVFSLNVSGIVCLDVGASTGGFTDCLLQHGARRVFSVDVGKGQLHWKLRQDPRVTILDEVNARYLKKEALSEQPAFACVDVSFISLTKVLPAVIQVLDPSAVVVTLIKPQFEAEREEVGEGGVVRDPIVRQRVVENIRRWGAETTGLEWVGCCESPLKGPAGNVEFLACWRKIGRREP